VTRLSLAMTAVRVRVLERLDDYLGEDNPPGDDVCR